MSGASLRDVADLVAAGLVAPERAATLAPVVARYAVAVTPAVAALIDRGDPNDPIARQFLPEPDELHQAPEERADPIGDNAHAPMPGLVHRYPDRVLLKVVQVCPVYCRFCFRRESVGPGAAMLSGTALEAALAYIREHTEIWEVILTGGDPLTLSPRRLAAIMTALGTIAHVRIVRLHSRVPAVDPSAITPALIAALTIFPRTLYVALHANHPRELTHAARSACAALIGAGIAMISQTVLLRGINDDAEVLAALMRGFVEMRVKPYYLHHPDLAPGTAHLRVPIARGQALVRALQGRLSGLCQPTYVLDIPGGFGKAPIGPVYAQPEGEGWQVTDYNGGSHTYPPVETASS